ncbi:MAG TPA: hypothetical protein VHY91_20820 [Pirellulales bacterium]|nr:hypothetical protein [Pirellulales bacterium]
MFKLGRLALVAVTILAGLAAQEANAFPGRRLAAFRAQRTQGSMMTPVQYSPAPTPTPAPAPTPAAVEMPAVVEPVAASAATAGPAALADLVVTDLTLVDPGIPSQQLGPRFRITIANQSAVNVYQEFEVLLLAGNEPKPVRELPSASMRIHGLDAGATTRVDLRLPLNTSYHYLFPVVDDRQEVADCNPSNNLATVSVDQPKR